MYLHQMDDFELSDSLDLLEDALNNAFGINAVEKPINEAIGLLTQEFYRREEFDLDFEQMWREGHALFMEEQVLSNVPDDYYNIYRLHDGEFMCICNMSTYAEAEKALNHYRTQYAPGKRYPNGRGFYPNRFYYIAPG